MSALPAALVADLEEFEDWLVGCNYAHTTITTRMFTINSAMKEWQTWDVRPSAVAGWLRAHSGWTASTYYTHLRCAFGWAQETGRIEVSPMAKLRSPASPDPTPRPLPLAVMQEALATAHGNLRAWLLLAYLAGLRSHEVAKFRGEDIAPDQLTVVGKGGRSARLPTHPDLWELAQDYPRVGYWFAPKQGTAPHISASFVGRRVREHLRALGVETGSIHRVRASYGTELLRSGANIRVVQDLMRHRSLATTEHYLGVATDDRRDAIRGLSISGVSAADDAGPGTRKSA